MSCSKWLAREDRAGLCVGNTWYVVAMAWWMQWLEYVQQVSFPCEI